MQYLEQKSKWERENTGNYVYLQFHNGGVYYFIKENDFVYSLRFGNAYSLESLKSKNDWNDFGYIRFGLEKDYLIESRFEEIQSILWEKLWDGTPLQRYNKSEQYSIEIVYNQKYGYPMMISHILHDKQGKPIPSSSASCMLDTSWHTSSIRLKMLPKDLQYDKEILQNILNEIKKYYKKAYPDVELVEKVGGGSIEGRVLCVIK
jgi:hypothetical protein